MDERQRRIELQLRRGHPDEESYAPPAWETVRTRPVARVAADGLRRPLSLMTAATISVAVLVVAGLTFGLAGSLGPNPAPVATTPSASQIAVVSPTSSSAETAPPASSEPKVDCGAIDATTCERVMTELETDGGSLATATLATYAPVCFVTRQCMPPFGGYQYDVRVMGTSIDGEAEGWACSTRQADVRCDSSPEADRFPPANLSIRFAGATSNPIVIQLVGDGRQSAGGWEGGGSGFRSLFVGKYRIGIPAMPCENCRKDFGPPASNPPKGWCASPFEATHGAQIEAVITIDGPDACHIDVTVSAATATSCQAQVAAPSIHVGETGRIEASGLTAGGFGMGLADLHRDGQAVPLTFGPDGTFVREFTAGAWMVGDHDVGILDPLSGCTARTSLRIDP